MPCPLHTLGQVGRVGHIGHIGHAGQKKDDKDRAKKVAKEMPKQVRHDEQRMERDSSPESSSGSE